MSNAKRSYYVVEGPDSDALRKMVLLLQQKHKDSLLALQTKHRAHGLITRYGKPVTLVIDPDFKVSTGLMTHKTREYEGKTYFEYVPNMRRKAGMEIQAEFDQIGEFSGSDLILSHYRVNSVFPEGDSLWLSTAGIMDGKIVIQIPTDDSNSVTIPASFREITREEFVALTGEPA